MSSIALILGTAFFLGAIFSGYTWIESLIFLISIVVANIPEGLLP